MPDFDWQTEKHQLIPPVEDDNEPKGRRWLAGVILILILGLAGLMVYGIINQAVDRATARAQRTLLSSFNLVQRAVVNLDEELFTLLLADGDLAWASEQKALLDQGLLFDRSPFSLQVQTAEPKITDIAFSPDLTTATILFEQAYEFDASNDIREGVTLQQTAVFQYNDEKQRWLLSQPAADFWGDRKTTAGEILTVIYSERDEALVSRLAPDLDRQLADMCATLAGLDCPAGLQIRLQLENQPGSLAQMADRKTFSTGSRSIALPSPTLIGTPIDETGYQALYRGYAAQVAAAAISSSVDWQCCRHAPFYHALLDKQLSQLALRPWPLTTADYQTMWSRYFWLDDLDALWRSSSVALTDAEWWQVYTFTDFLTEAGTNVPISRLLYQLSQSPSFRDWVNQLTQENFPTEFDLKRGWLLFVYEQTPSARASPPIPLPRDVQLFCLSGVHDELYRYDLATDAWSTERSLGDDVSGVVSSLPGKDGIILQARQRSETNKSQAWAILQDGAETSIPVAALGSVFYPINSSADSLRQSLLTVSYRPGQELGQFTLLDLASCSAANCDSISFAGLPVWSPDGAQTIVSTTDGNGSFHLTLADGEGRPLKEIGTGFSPFWLDNDAYGYTHAVNDMVELVVTTTTGGETLTRLRGADLVAALPEDERPEVLSISHVHSNPANPDVFFIDAVAPSLRTQYIFSFDRQSKEVALNLRFDGRYRPVSLDFSPDGRWWTLSVHTNPSSGPEWSLYLHDIENNQTRLLAFSPIPYVGNSYDWSADGQWLLKVDIGYISLIAPAHDYQELILIDPSMCTSAAWVRAQ